MQPETADFFNLMRMAYEKGVLEKMSEIQSTAMEGLEGEAGWNAETFMELMDSADPSGVEDRLQRSRVPVRLLSSGWAMSGISRLLDFPIVRRRVTGAVRKKLERMVSETATRQQTCAGDPS